MGTRHPSASVLDPPRTASCFSPQFLAVLLEGALCLPYFFFAVMDSRFAASIQLGDDFDFVSRDEQPFRISSVSQFSTDDYSGAGSDFAQIAVVGEIGHGDNRITAPLTIYTQIKRDNIALVLDFAHLTVASEPTADEDIVHDDTSTLWRIGARKRSAI
jgi:hypothetical protein